MDLFDLVNSFIDKGYGAVHEKEEIGRIDDEDEDYDKEVMMKDSLKRLLLGFTENNDNDDVKATTWRKNVLLQVEKACHCIPKDTNSSSAYKSQLVAHLRHQGIDAGLCKSKWEKNGRVPSGYYEYIDANIKGTRYIIEISLPQEFEIARPSDFYTLLLNVFPQIVVCKVEELKKIVGIMCDAIKKSMKQQQMHVPPWRRHEYVSAKWFGPYKRFGSDQFQTKNVVADSNSNKGGKGNGVVGLLSFPNRNCYRSGRKEREFGFEIGNLAMAFKGGN
ncbi:uncharacterized protein [Rutidosis leptorrhynchoides]|uniref:uncharacterized protein n=1 Tax=Rutidosis leptorrhynchoides TaxID=125765 RepID=UPI003A99B83D